MAAQCSFAADLARLGVPGRPPAPEREVRLGVGAAFIVAIYGNTMNMPGMPKMPSVEMIRLKNGPIEGLF